MFYSQFILAKKGPLGTIWIAAHLERKLRKNQVADTDIGVSVDSILQPDVPIALRLSSHLLLGVVRIYNKKVNYLFDDCSEALLKVKQAFRATAVDLPPEQTKAPYHSITLPETFDLDDFELPDNDALQSDFVDHHVSARDQITLQDTMEGVTRSSVPFGLDERFGDGDTSGLDLNADLFLDRVGASGHAGVSSSANPQASAIKPDDQHEGMAAHSEPMMDNDDEVIHFMEDAQAPRTPTLVQEPNFSNAQETSACDDHFESEHHNLIGSTRKELLETRGNKNEDDRSISGDKISHSAVPELPKNSDVDIKQLKPPEILSSATIEQFSSDNHASTSGHVTQVFPVSEVVNRIDGTSDFRNLKEQMHQGIIDNEKANMYSVHESVENLERSQGSNLRKNVNEIAGSVSTFQQGVPQYNHSSPVMGVSGNLEGGKSQALNLDINYQVMPSHDKTEWQTLINRQTTTTGEQQVQFLRPCNTNLVQPDSRNIIPNESATLNTLQGFGHVSETATIAQGLVSEKITRVDNMREGEGVFGGIDHQSNDGYLGRRVVENLNGSAGAELSAPEKMMSVRDVPNNFRNNNLLMESTPGEFVRNYFGDTGSNVNVNVISGKTPNYTGDVMRNNNLVMDSNPGDVMRNYFGDAGTGKKLPSYTGGDVMRNNNNLIMESTPEDSVRNYFGDTGSNVVSGKKPSYTGDDSRNNNSLMESTPGDSVRNYFSDAQSNVISGKKPSYTGDDSRNNLLMESTPGEFVRNYYGDAQSSVILGKKPSYSGDDSRNNLVLKSTPTPGDDFRNNNNLVVESTPVNLVQNYFGDAQSNVIQGKKPSYTGDDSRNNNNLVMESTPVNMVQNYFSDAQSNVVQGKTQSYTGNDIRNNLPTQSTPVDSVRNYFGDSGSNVLSGKKPSYTVTVNDSSHNNLVMNSTPTPTPGDISHNNNLLTQSTPVNMVQNYYGDAQSNIISGKKPNYTGEGFRNNNLLPQVTPGQLVQAYYGGSGSNVPVPTIVTQNDYRNNSLQTQSNPGDLVKNYFDDAWNNVLAGNKRTYTQSTVTDQTLNSVDTSRVVRTKVTVNAPPRDMDALSSILVERGSSKVKVKPPPKEKASVKRTPRTTAVKRKVLMDEAMVLHGETIRLQLLNTEDIRRVRKKAPCTCPDITMIQRQFLLDELFFEPLSIGVSNKIASLHNQKHDLSKIRVTQEEVHVEAPPSAEINKLEEVNRGQLEVNITQPQVHVTTDVQLNSSLVQPTENVTVLPPTSDMNKLYEGSNVHLEVQPIESQVNQLYEGSNVHLEVQPTESQVNQLYKGSSNVHLEVETTESQVNKPNEGTTGVHLEVHSTQSQEKENITADVEQNSLLFEPPENVTETETIIPDRVDVSLLDESTLHMDQSDRVDISIAPVDDISANMVQMIDNNRTSEAEASTDISHDQKIDQVSLQIDATSAEEVVYGHKIVEKEAEGEIGDAETVETETVPDEANNKATNYDSQYLGIEQSILDSFFPGEEAANNNNNNNNEDEEKEEEEEEGAVLESGEHQFQESVNPFNTMHEEDGEQESVNPFNTIDVNNSPAWDNDNDDDNDNDNYNDIDNDDDYDDEIVGNDTEFLNFDNDDDDYEEGFAEPADDDNITDKEAQITDNSGWSSRTRAVSNYLQTLFGKQAGSANPTLSLDTLLVGKTKKEASRLFFEALVLKTKDYIHVEQETPFENITLNPRAKLMKSDF